MTELIKEEFREKLRKISNETKNHFFQIGSENADNNDPLNQLKETKGKHRRYNSNSYLGEYTSNFNKQTKIINREEGLSSNKFMAYKFIQNNNTAMSRSLNKPGNSILDFNVSFDRKVFSPTQSQKDAFFSGDRINNFSSNFYVSNEEVIKSNKININFGNVNNENNKNEKDFSTLNDGYNNKKNISRSIKLPSIQSAMGFMKINNINNYKNVLNIERNNNSLTPNKLILNAPTTSFINLTAKKDVGNNPNKISLRRFDYPSSTKILNSRVNIFNFIPIYGNYFCISET